MPQHGPNAPRRGSMAFWPRKRAKRIYPRIKTWPEVKETKLLAFAGYKVGMTHALLEKDGEKIFTPVTVLETPPLFVLGIKAYKKVNGALREVGQVLTNEVPKYVFRKIPKLKNYNFEEKMKQFEEKAKNADEIKVVVSTQPWLIKLKKTPEIFDVPLGGESVEQKLEYAKSILGKEINVWDVFKEGQQIDVIAVTKGKGFQGVIKRFGAHRLQHKAEKSIRKVGSLGPEGYARVLPTVPMPGKMGFHRRTEYNKLILKICKEPINVKGGWPHYGEVIGPVVLLKGSVPGPQKRLIIMREAIRPNPKLQALPIAYLSLTPKN